MVRDKNMPISGHPSIQEKAAGYSRILVYITFYVSLKITDSVFSKNKNRNGIEDNEENIDELLS